MVQDLIQRVVSEVKEKIPILKWDEHGNVVNFYLDSNGTFTLSYLSEGALKTIDHRYPVALCTFRNNGTIIVDFSTYQKAVALLESQKKPEAREQIALYMEITGKFRELIQKIPNYVLQEGGDNYIQLGEVK